MSTVTWTKYVPVVNNNLYRYRIEKVINVAKIYLQSSVIRSCKCVLRNIGVGQKGQTQSAEKNICN
jgi:hypothetical protein